MAWPLPKGSLLSHSSHTVISHIAVSPNPKIISNTLEKARTWKIQFEIHTVLPQTWSLHMCDVTCVLKWSSLSLLRAVRPDLKKGIAHVLAAKAGLSVCLFLWNTNASTCLLHSEVKSLKLCIPSPVHLLEGRTFKMQHAHWIDRYFDIDRQNETQKRYNLSFYINLFFQVKWKDLSKHKLQGICHKPNEKALRSAHWPFCWYKHRQANDIKLCLTF